MTPAAPTTFVLRLGIAASIALTIAGQSRAEGTLPDRIDALIRAGHKEYAKLAAPLAADDEFVRRIYLDLTGIIPSAADARAFLADKSPDRRVKLVDRLLASEAHALHLTNQFDVLWLDRRADRHVKKAEWRRFLFESFARNKPYDELVRDVLGADGSDPKNRAPAAFFLNRDAEPHLITKDVGRLFLGMNLGCAQCHDHPLVEHYKQDFYYGIYAFLNRSYLFADKAAKVSLLAEKADGDVTFQSVFMAKVTKNTNPRLPGGPDLKEPKFDKGKEYVEPVKQGQRGIPKFSRRLHLGTTITSPENGRFARAAVNRLWSFYLGRGIIHPIEYDHADNPPSHPELLDLLAKEFAASKYDMRALTRAIVLSQTYQRSSQPPAEAKDIDAKWFAVAQLRPLTPEQFAWSLMQASGLLDIERRAQGARATDKTLHDKFAGNVEPFVNLFGNQPGEPAVNQDFEATLDQTLFLSNGSTLRDWLTPRGGNLVDRLNQQKNADALAEELYVSVLSRLPGVDERKELADYLARRGADRVPALQEFVWAMLTSAEFRFDH